MSRELDDVRRVRPCCRPKDQLERVLRIHLETRELRRGILKWVGDNRKAFAVTIDIQRAESSGGKLDWRPFQRD